MTAVANPNLPPSAQAGIVGVIDPDAYGAGAQNTPWIDMSQFEALLAIIQAGTLGTSATLDAKLQEAQDASGTGAKDIAGKAIAQLTQAGGDSDKQALINVHAQELDVEGGFTHVRLQITIGVAASDAAGLVQGFYPRYGPASDQDLASVDEIVDG